MSERRPHWDDELFDAVIDGFRITPYDDEVYAVIAAVEDWQEARGDAIDGRSLTEAIFAVQRVRALHSRNKFGECDHCADSRHGSYPCPTIRALDGGDDD